MASQEWQQYKKYKGKYKMKKINISIFFKEATIKMKHDSGRLWTSIIQHNQVHLFDNSSSQYDNIHLKNKLTCLGKFQLFFVVFWHFEIHDMHFEF
jgi:hypothetical protein